MPRNHVFWTDVLSPSTLRYYDKNIEAEVRLAMPPKRASLLTTHAHQYQRRVRAQRATPTALGSLVEGSMNIFMAARTFTPQFWLLHRTPLSFRRMRYAVVVALLCPFVRGFPYLWWAINRKQFIDWLVPMCVIPRLISVVFYALHNMAHAQVQAGFAFM